MGHFHSFKNIYFFCWAISFVLFTVHVDKNVQVTFYIISPKSFYYKTYFVFKTISSIIVICLTPADKFLDLIFRNNFFIFNFSKMCSRWKL